MVKCLKEDSIIRIGVTDIKRFLDKLQEIKFPPEISDGQTVLPKAIEQYLEEMLREILLYTKIEKKKYII